jgi:hypothetical protein
MFNEQRVIYQSACIDCHFERRDSEAVTVNERLLRERVRLRDVTVTVTDNVSGWYLPAAYGLKGDHTLVSWRLGHRGLFRPGARLRLPWVDYVETAAWGDSRGVYLLLEDQWVDVEPGR